MIDLKAIKPNKVSTDLHSYSAFIYGEPKIGKTSFVHDLYGDRVLHIMTEKRYKTLEGAYVQYVSSWSEYLQVMRQLKNKEIREQFDVVSIDTVDNLYGFLEKFVAAKWQEESIGSGKAGFGQDWTDLKNMWKDGLMKIEQAGYTPVFVGHSVQASVQVPLSGVLQTQLDELKNAKEVKDKNGSSYIEFQKYIPDLKDKVIAPINKMVDNILFLSMTVDANGNEHRVIHTRSSMQWLAGSTFKNIQSPVELNATAYQNAVEQAVGEVPDEYKNEDKVSDSDITNETPDFDATMERAKKLGFTLANSDKANRVKAVVDKVFGLDAKLTGATKEQIEQLVEAVQLLEEEVKDAGLEVE